MEFIEALQWRYATKKMNGEEVKDALVQKIIQVAHLAPTSSGLQPFEVIAVSNKELREKIHPIAYKQPQILDGSHVLIFASWDEYTSQRIDAVFAHMDKERGLEKGFSDDYKESLKEKLQSWSKEKQAEHAAKQAYIGLGMAIAQAALLKVDATPMEGFENEKVDQLLGLDKKGLKSQAFLTLGYRASEGDWLQPLKKVRKPWNEFLTEHK